MISNENVINYKFIDLFKVYNFDINFAFIRFLYVACKLYN